VVQRAILFLSLGVIPPLFADNQDDLFLGIESVTGLRSDYIYRGFQLADASLDVQIETEIALENDLFVGLAAWHVAESSGDFSETAFGVSLHRNVANYRFSGSLDYRSFSESFFDDGVDLGIKAQWLPNENWDFAARAHYDFGVEGSYFAIEGGWSHPLTKDLFIAAETGISAVSDYLDRDGLNDFNGRVSLTYNINSYLSLTPFVGYSIALASEADDEAYAGVWLAVSF